MSEAWEYVDCPWRRSGESVYEWIAARPELYDEKVWKPQVLEYQPCQNGPQPPNTPGVYFLLENDWRILYIGKASQLATRIWAHWRAGRVPFTHIAWIALDARDALEILEAHLIGREAMPPYNVKFCCSMESWHKELAGTIAARVARGDS